MEMKKALMMATLCALGLSACSKSSPAPEKPPVEEKPKVEEKQPEVKKEEPKKEEPKASSSSSSNVSYYAPPKPADKPFAIDLVDEMKVAKMSAEVKAAADAIAASIVERLKTNAGQSGFQESDLTISDESSDVLAYAVRRAEELAVLPDHILRPNEIQDETLDKVTVNQQTQVVTHDNIFPMPTAGENIAEAKLALAQLPDAAWTALAGKIKNGDYDTLSVGAYFDPVRKVYVFYPILTKSSTQSSGGYTFEDSAKSYNTLKMLALEVGGKTVTFDLKAKDFGKWVSASKDDIKVTMSGFKDSRFGMVEDNSNANNPSLKPFAQGRLAVEVPTTGTAEYNGIALAKVNGVDELQKYTLKGDFDFAQNTAELTFTPVTATQTVTELKAKADIYSDGFMSTSQGVNDVRVYGRFYGEQADEIAGTVHKGANQGDDVKGAFGAKK